MNCMNGIVRVMKRKTRKWKINGWRNVQKLGFKQ